MVGTRSVTDSTLGAWVIKCNPSKTDLAPMHAAGAARSSWCVADNYRSGVMAPGQSVVFWVSAHRRRGVWGVGRLTSAPYRSDGTLAVSTHIPFLREPFEATELKLVPGLQEMEVFRSPQQANPSWVSVDEWAILEPLLAARAAPT